MKKIIGLSILLWMFSFISLYAENESEAFRKQMWETEAFKDVQIPEKYLNGSCVIMNRSYEYQLRPVLIFIGLSCLDVTTMLHNRVKILDKAGIEEYSTFSFEGEFVGDNSSRKINDNVFAGFKIIKSDGKEIEIDIRNLLTTDEAERGRDKATLNKVSIPDLEVGDVLDYYFVKKVRNSADYNGFYNHETQVFYLSDVYPILHQVITLKCANKCYLSCKSFNGAPDMQVLNESEKSCEYRLVDENRDALKKEKWVNRFMDSPFVKYQIAFINLGNNFSYNSFINKKIKFKKDISQEELLGFVNYFVDFKYKYSGAKLVRPYIQKRKPKTLEDKIFRVFDEAKRYNIGLTDKRTFLFDTPPLKFSNEGTAVILTSLLKKYKIPYSLLLTTDKSEIKLEDLFLRDDIIVVIRIDAKNPYYISGLMPFSVLTDIDPYLAGNKAYEIQIYPKIKKAALKQVTIPDFDYKANNSKALVDVSVSFDSLITYLDINQSLQNSLRYAHQYNLVGRADLYEEYERHFGPKEFVTLYSSRTKPSILKKQEDKINDVRKEQVREREEYIKDMVKSEYNLNKDFTLSQFEILDYGLFNEGNVFSFKIKGQVEDLVSKVGRNYMLDAGKLISSQISLDEEMRNTREFNIYIGYPRSYENTVVINIPDGYRVKGLDLFNANVVSSVGGFTSKAVQEGRKITITTYKYYSKGYADKLLWNEFVPFIDEAFNVSQKQLLFEKL